MSKKGGYLIIDLKNIDLNSIDSDGTYAVTLNATETEYFTIKVSGGPVTNSNYEIAFLG
nr:MAG TPA: hypothetical protein [Caudoviricetes sp.]